MKISVIGCGYLGAVHAACMAVLGHRVVGVDTDEAKVAALAAGRSPFHEPGFDALLADAVHSGRLRFTTEASVRQLGDVDVHFLAVGTPQRPDSPAADLGQLWTVVESLVGVLGSSWGALVVGKSTVPVGTAAAVARRLEPVGATVVWNPEFLREGFAIDDTLHPDRLVYGLPGDPERADSARARLDEVYAPLLAEGIPRLVTDYATAELVKVAANSFLATKISFINAMAEVCEATGGDVTVLADALGYDPRIGRRFLGAGIGFGGGCLPKDIRAFMATADEQGWGESVAFLREVDAINLRRRAAVVRLAAEALGRRSVDGARIAVLGAAFKPDSDDIRDSPALDIARRLHRRGARVTICDPEALPVVERHHPELATEPDPFRAMRGAELVLLLTEWREFRELDPERAAGVVAVPRIIDGRNALDANRWEDAGWEYRALGRAGRMAARVTSSSRRPRARRPDSLAPVRLAAAG